MAMGMEEERGKVRALIEKATSSTAAEVDPRLLKAIKSVVRFSESELRLAAHILMDLMKRDHSQVHTYELRGRDGGRAVEGYERGAISKGGEEADKKIGLRVAISKERQLIYTHRTKVKKQNPFCERAEQKGDVGRQSYDKRNRYARADANPSHGFCFSST